MTTITRRLGHSDITVRPFCLGGNVFGWTIDETASFQVLDTFAAAGFEFIDTADMYSRWKPGNSGGESEAIIGRWMKQRGNRSRMVIATKVGMEMPPSSAPGMAGAGKGLSRAWILKEVEASLHRLQTDYIDVYYSHQDDPATPLEETLEAYAQLVKQGKVRLIGASNYSGDRLSESIKISTQHGYPRYDILQPHYNLVERKEFESTLRPVCAKHNIAVAPYFSLASGFLTGKYRTEADLQNSARGKSVKKYINAAGFRVVAALEEVAKRHNASPAQVALAWLIVQPTVVAPIASATSVKQLNELLPATTLQLDEASIADLNQASD